ncbi:HlyC/CorC family transporter [bacterium]|nr:HlyC/CorC family transporter [bacterium]
MLIKIKTFILGKLKISFTKGSFSKNLDDYELLGIKFLGFLLTLLTTALFSGSETAFFSLKENQLKDLSLEESSEAQRILKLLKNPKKLLVTVVTGKILAILILARLSFAICEDFGFQTFTLLITIIVTTFIVVILGENSPKIFAIKNPMVFIRKASLPITFLQFLLFPLTFFVSSITKFSFKAFHFGKWKQHISEDELKTLVGVDEEKSENLEKEEREMIHSIFELGDTTVKEIMIPRIDMVCVNSNASLDEVVKIIQTEAFSRVPIYEDRIDNIKGIVYAKDLIKHISSKPNKNLKLLEIARPASFVTETKKLDELLKDFKKEKIHIAIVVDEYGGTAGLVTLEDIIEEIVGEINDEYDNEDKLYEKTSENTFIFNGKIEIEKANEILEADFPEDDDFATLGGFITSLTGNIPSPNELVSYKNYDFKILRVEKRRITKVQIVKNAIEPNGEIPQQD